MFYDIRPIFYSKPIIVGRRFFVLWIIEALSNASWCVPSFWHPCLASFGYSIVTTCQNNCAPSFPCQLHWTGSHENSLTSVGISVCFGCCKLLHQLVCLEKEMYSQISVFGKSCKRQILFEDHPILSIMLLIW